MSALGLQAALALAAAAAGPEASLNEARTAGQRGDFAHAAEGYAAAAAALPLCGDLEYDIGTSAAQADQVGSAVLHLERALRESPWDADARQNLERIRQKRVDKVLGQEPGESPVQRLAAGLPGRALFWAALGLWWLGFFAWWWRKRFAGSSALAFACSVLCYAGALAWIAERQVRYGVVLSGRTDGIKVHTGPAEDLPAPFEVHDGLKVLLLDSENGFTHLRLGNGLEGFVRDGEVEAI